ncbi:MAG: ADP compounds hydrolase NudE [Candidatus Thiosymbion ectosymbiont of Robbea hypermnestra]|nr:ADP compounds hydrolase NudE [Candidatus Thiosymbion ectosymbiont of Robbea hypermnestra]
MAAKPRILGRRLAARTRIFRVEQIDLAFANGNHRCFERVLGGRGSVLVVPMPDPQTILLAREYAAGLDRYELGFPKGIVEPEEDLLEAAGREIREEIGFGARDLRLIRKVSPAPGYIQHETHLVLARGLYPDRAQGDEPEPIEVVPWRLDDSDALLARDDFTEARSIAALFLARRFLEREKADA